MWLDEFENVYHEVYAKQFVPKFLELLIKGNLLNLYKTHRYYKTVKIDEIITDNFKTKLTKYKRNNCF